MLKQHSDGFSFDLQAFKPAQLIELWEDGAGGLLITQAGEKNGFDVSNAPSGFFAPDAYSLATGDFLENWNGQLEPVDRKRARLIATWEAEAGEAPESGDDGLLKTFNPGTNGFRYICRD